MKASAPVARTAVPAPPATMLLWINGRRVSAEGSHLSAFDRGCMLGDGLFETMRMYNGMIFRLDRHLSRLMQGARVLQIPLPAELPATVAAAVADACAAEVRNAAVRLTITRGVGAPGLAPPDQPHPVTLIAIRPYSRPDAAPMALSASIARGRRNEHAITSGFKTLAYTESVIALAEARAGGVDEAIFLDTADHVSEATSSNVFLVHRHELITPPLSCGILPGVTREAVLELARAEGLSIHQRPVAVYELAGAAEAFCTSSLREIAPLVRLSGHDIGRGVAGELTRHLTTALAALVARECTA